jgi:CRP-like cAMP-binding protein
MDGQGHFESSSLFDQMDEDEIKRIMKRFKRINFPSGETIFRENDPGDKMYIVEEGSVSLKKRIVDDFEKTIFVAYSGFVFGEFSFIDGKERSASAVADIDSVILSITRNDFEAFIKENPSSGIKLYHNLLGTITNRLRQTNDAYRDAVRWGIEATRTQNLTFQHFISEKVPIRLDLTNDRTFEGRILQFEHGEAGYELIIVDQSGEITMIPYHAIISISVSQGESVA